MAKKTLSSDGFAEKSPYWLLSPNLWRRIPAVLVVFDGGAWVDPSLHDVRSILA